MYGEEAKAAIKWWSDRQTRFPRLSKMAFDILTIPGMSSESERVFSHGSLTLSIQRQSIKDDALEKLLCLQNWQRNRRK